MGRRENQPTGKNHAVQQRRSGAMNTLFKTAALSVLAVACAMLMGCEAITDLGKPTAPGHLMWEKPNSNIAEVKAERQACGRQIQNNEELMAGKSKDRADHFDLCMLQKGFKFVPKPEGWGNSCIRDGALWNRIACKSARGEYQLPTPGETR
jgi:hypothetical protein